MKVSTNIVAVTTLWQCLVWIAAAVFMLNGPLARASEPLPSAISFTRDVEPALTRLGCNSGACHGAFSGRGGFRLSLWGFDPLADHESLVSDARGRRINAAAPERSLLLRKPTLAMPHAGGQRLQADSESYQILRTWITQGLPRPSEADPALVRLNVEPGELSLSPGASALLRVTAEWSDGEARDVTRWTRFQNRLDAVATVSEDGAVAAHGPGRTDIAVLYGGHVFSVPVTVPFAPPVEFAFEPRNFIDVHVAAEWRKMGLSPAADASDAEFLRRTSLDIIGTLPTPAEARSFFADSSADKRTRWIDALLERPEYADFWAMQWSDRLKVHRRSLGEKGLTSFSEWLRQSLRTNRPTDALVRDLLTAQGNLYASGPVAFYFTDRTPEDLAETTAQALLGVRLQCAHCHHHPFESWSQDDYYGLAAFFARVERKDTKEAGRFGGAQSIALAATGAVVHPRTGQPVTPALLGRAAKVAAGSDERQALADSILDPAQPLFAGNIVNRYWGDLIGRGLVEPVDDLRSTNPASHPALLDALAADFVSHGFDLKHLIRTICNSRVYQLASERSPQRDAEGLFCTHRVPRRMAAEVLLDAVNAAAGAQETFDGFPSGTRAIALPDPAVASYSLDVFGRPLRVSVCECERASRVDLRQVLNLSNSNALQAKLASPSGRVATLVSAGRTDAEIIDELYLAALSRLPTEVERQTATAYVTGAASRQEGFEDLLWTLLNLPEFCFNH